MYEVDLNLPDGLSPIKGDGPEREKRIEPLTGMLYPETNETFEASEGLGNGLQTLINCI